MERARARDKDPEDTIHTSYNNFNVQTFKRKGLTGKRK